MTIKIVCNDLSYPLSEQPHSCYITPYSKIHHKPYRDPNEVAQKANQRFPPALGYSKNNQIAFKIP